MKYVSVFCVMLLSVVLASCGGSSDAPSDASTTPTPEVEKATEIKIGLLAPLSGGASSYGEDAVNVATMLADEVNAGGGIDGAMVKVIPEDGACNGQSAVGAVQKLINIDGVEVIMGGLCSPETISAGKIAQAKGVTMVSALSSAPEVSNVGDHVFRYYNDLDAAKTVVAYLEDIGARNIAAIHINNEYGNAYIDAVGSEFGGTISLREKINDEEKDFTLIAKKIAGSIDDIDALIIVFVSESQNVSIIKSLDSEGVLEALDRNVIGGEGFLTDAVLADVGEMADGLKGTQFPQIGNLGGDSGSFIEAYKANYEIGSGDVFVVLHAESFHLIIDAIREVGNDGDAVAKYISSITQDTPRSGLFGDYYFKGSDAQALNFVVFEAKGGELQPLEK